MTNFKVGQKVKCITECTNGVWWGEDDEMCGGPQLDEELVIDAFDSDGGLIFFKYDKIEGYNPIYFAPLQYSSASFELALSFKEVLETSDQPIKELQNN